MASCERIAVFLPNWVGDVAMATPALGVLRERFGGARITFVGRQIALDTLAGLGLADAEIADPGRRSPRLRNFAALVERVARERFDLAILLPNSFRAAALAWLGRARRIAGYDRDLRGWMLTDRLRPARDAKGRFVPVSAIDYYNALAVRLGASAPSRQMRLCVRPEDAAAADTLLEQGGLDPARPLVLLNPGASGGVSKMWRSERYAQLGDRLIEQRGAQIIVNAAPAEKPIAAEVLRAMRGRALLDFATRDNTLGLLKALIARCDLVVTNDTGARHLAAALGAGLVTLFGSTDPRWASIDCERERIVRIPVPCSPCQKKICPQFPGPLYHQCMELLTVEAAMAACEEVLDLPRRRA